MEYICSDIDLRTDVIMFLGELKLRLEKELKCNFNLHNNVTPLPEEMEEEGKEVMSGVEECGFFKQYKYAGTDHNYFVAVRIQKAAERFNRRVKDSKAVDLIICKVNCQSF